MSTVRPLAGLRVLLVEDEMLISLMIEELLREQGCVIVGPHDRVPDALASAQTEAIDLALLDVNLAGVKVYPVAEVLDKRGIPFLLLSGYGESGIPANHPEWRICGKPFRYAELVSMLIEQAKPAA